MTPTSPKLHISQQLLNNIKSLPLWVKQVIYFELQEEMAQHFSPETMEGLSAADTVAFYTPKLTPDAEKHLGDLKSETGRLLMDAQQKLTVLDMCLRYNWSLETCCHSIMEALESNCIEPPSSVKALGTIEYMANRIRLGEYLVKMGRITLEQLEQALRTQQYIKEALQDHTGLANILINLGYITRQDTEGILFLKEESRKPLESVGILERLA